MVWEAEAVGDDPSKKTPINLTNHAYWNLSGDFKEATIADHHLNLGCSKMLPMGEGSVPTGEIAAVADTPFDFTGDEQKYSNAS